MVPFAGYLMPLQYPAGIKEEYSAVREKVGIFDVSHMGEFKISGTGAESFLQNLTINNVSNLMVGQAQYSAMCLPTSGIIDDLILYRFKDHYLMVVNASNINKNWKWLKDHCPDNVELKNISDEVSLIAIQGPESKNQLKPLFPKVVDLTFYNACYSSYNGQEVIISRTGYTGELGFEVYGNQTVILEIWNILNTSELVTPCGLAVRDILRLEMKYCLYGNDINEKTNPLEAGLGWVTSLEKDFIGKDELLKFRERGLSKRLAAIQLKDRGIPRVDYEIYSGGNVVGKMTSGTHSPSLNCGIDGRDRVTSPPYRERGLERVYATKLIKLNRSSQHH